MDMKTYLKQVAPEEREALAAAVESSVGYFYLLGGGHRKPSSDLCKLLVAAEPRLTLHELRPDIWDETPAPPAPHRSTDQPPEPGRAGRSPQSAAKLMSAATESVAVLTKHRP